MWSTDSDEGKGVLKSLDAYGSKTGAPSSVQNREIESENPGKGGSALWQVENQSLQL